MQECKIHGLTRFIKKGEKYTRCAKCLVEAVDSSRKKKKQELIDYLGGACAMCGYDKCNRALQFHHVDPKSKSFNLADGRSFSMKKLKAEVDKCILVCANCHMEIEDTSSS